MNELDEKSSSHFSGILEDFIIFWDEPTQRTRIGHDMKSCYFTRNVVPDSRVTGHTALIAIEISDQLLRLTINGEIFLPYRRNIQ